MTTLLTTAALLTSILLAAAPALAQTPGPAETAARAKATLADFSWLIGEWDGTGLGGETQEMWSPPAGGAMMGLFRQLKAGQLVFYEFLTLVERDGSVVLRLKHFHPDLTGWEEKAQVLEFPLVSLTPTQAVFNAMTFAHETPDAFSVRLRLEDKSGTVREELFEYRRVRR
ncbi:MAG TPA: DUF6265 family protein [Vicinamibacterales bacterium]|nr:DUF6265 family protein [Vicinamibacterales bacterium]